ncbi:hypothetical protein [Streptomyces sp. WAC01280]|uniref:hypothetical protein n=1 Tax=Streptomyces sp. WAC01280 TaxID=2487424 RepID=UPI000F78D846|nr:hypothetical protein [Streptomyces sp. WAC01280]RSS55533.1 hypothetical protein EF909_20550 [Streptomyces sp. WAC01280]
MRTGDTARAGRTGVKHDEHTRRTGVGHDERTCAEHAERTCAEHDEHAGRTCVEHDEHAPGAAGNPGIDRSHRSP